MTRVLVVDDSATNRRAITEALESLPDVEVVGKAANGEEALRMVHTFAPELVTLDLEMPKMDGFTFLRLLMAGKPTPVIVISGRSAKADVFRALELGAIDFLVKPDAASTLSLREELARKMEALRMHRPVVAQQRTTATGWLRALQTNDQRLTPNDTIPLAVVVIAASTGGPPALVEIFSKLPADLPASVVIAQHMPERFTTTFAARLEKLQGLRTSELTTMDALRAGHAYVIGGGRCAEVELKGGLMLLKAVMPAPTDRYVPNADRLFRSVAPIGERVLGVVLTGMGDDGCAGAALIRQHGGSVLVESEESAAINGMPGSVVRAGLASKVVSLNRIADEIVKFVRPSRSATR